jgi:hypothetical protein
MHKRSFKYFGMRSNTTVLRIRDSVRFDPWILIPNKFFSGSRISDPVFKPWLTNNFRVFLYELCYSTLLGSLGSCQRWYAWGRNHLYFYNWLISFTSFWTAYRVTRRFYLNPHSTFSFPKLLYFLRWETMWTYLAVQWWAARIFLAVGVPSLPRIISFTTGCLSTGSRYEWALLVFLYNFQKYRKGY